MQSPIKNMLSAENHPTVIEKYLGKELAHGRLIELHPMFVDRVHVSKFGAVPKKASIWKVAFDLSSPKGASVNDFIDPSLCSLSYASVDDIASFVYGVGQDCMLVKLNLSIEMCPCIQKTAIC